MPPEFIPTPPKPGPAGAVPKGVDNPLGGRVGVSPKETLPRNNPLGEVIPGENIEGDIPPLIPCEPNVEADPSQYPCTIPL